jgi:hypothetical protein
MNEPESHTLHLLREIREDVQKVDRKVDSLDHKVDGIHVDLKEVIGGLVQTLAGEMAERSYAGGGVERRLADIERRLSALEQGR